MPSAPCHARMAALQNHRGQPLTDADGQVLKVGSTVVDDRFCEVIDFSRRGTVSLDNGCEGRRWRGGPGALSCCQAGALDTVLDGFKLADELSELNASLVGSGVYPRPGRSTASRLAT